MINRDVINEYVQNGMALLDTVSPGWETKVDPDIIDVSSLSNCILGQVYGDYNTAMKEIEPFRPQWLMFEINQIIEACGFMVLPFKGENACLNAVWSYWVKERRGR